MKLPNVRFQKLPWAVLRAQDDFGIMAYDLVRPPSRLWPEDPPNLMRLHQDAKDVEALPDPLELLSAIPDGDNWQAQSQRSVYRLAAWFLLLEDPQRRLDIRRISTLAHQASLVHYVLSEASLQSVLIADEVGLGKTIEAGLLLQRLVRDRKDLRVLYLAPARLCANVHEELTRLGLSFRKWVSGNAGTATLEDHRVVASIHRHPAHSETFVENAKWDVIVVDECHHLSAWGANGEKPVRKYRLVDQLRRRLSESGRLILMSGTPHQGHPRRFQNLLALLRREDEPEEALAGRVIYRTKEDVRDWNGDPLFPRRQVSEPILVELGPTHREWLENIHRFFTHERLEEGDARERAAGWRVGQALQWATSSIQAGVGYLVRQAIRAGWTPDRQPLREALETLRPYRDGAVDEPIDRLYERIRREIRRQREDHDVADIENDADTPDWTPDEDLLAQVLSEGVTLLRDDPDRKWRHLEQEVLARAGNEKVVLFAQPIETVTALCDFLERRTGQRPARIIGNQPDEVRHAEIEAFHRTDGPQYLVSSRAGGEGVNLQVARRLVHVDVPWNPMELEQRVGRVHRFLSRRTIIVDTVVVANSREVDMYDVARGKLREIAETMGDDEPRFEMLFSRVMSLLPPESLQGVLGDRPLGPLDAAEREKVKELVLEGHHRWKQFHGQYEQRQRRLLQLDPGQAAWRDVQEFAERHLGAEQAEGYRALRFAFEGDEVVQAEHEATALRVGDQVFAIGEQGGMPVTAPDGTRVPGLGLNTTVLIRALREKALPKMPTGAAHLGWPEGRPRPTESSRFGLLFFARVSLRRQEDSWTEDRCSLHGYVVSGDHTRELTPVERAEVVRATQVAIARREAAHTPELVRALKMASEQLEDKLRRPSDDDREASRRHALFPLLAAIVS